MLENPSLFKGMFYNNIGNSAAKWKYFAVTLSRERFRDCSSGNGNGNHLHFAFPHQAWPPRSRSCWLNTSSLAFWTPGLGAGAGAGSRWASGDTTRSQPPASSIHRYLILSHRVWIFFWISYTIIFHWILDLDSQFTSTWLPDPDVMSLWT